MKELVVISGKGGTGKTSITGALATLMPNAILADCDVDAPDLHLLLNPDIQKKETFSGGKVARIDKTKCNECNVCRQVCRFDAITTSFAVEDMSCEGCGVCVWNCPEKAISFENRNSGEWYFSKTRFGEMVHARLFPGEENSGKLVTQVRKAARELGKEKNADYLLVDGPPGVGCPVISSIGGADLLLVVTEPTRSAIHDMQRALDLAKHFNIPATVCINKYDLNKEMTGEIESYCADRNLPVLGKIVFDKEFITAQIQGKAVIELDIPGLKTSFQFLLNKILEILPAEGKEPLDGTRK
ncbi:ATP-binding protein [candidate division KSB1 bacterium]|nr:ATP-binding protein [candidate division KSB1 bacterium]